MNIRILLHALALHCVVVGSASAQTSSSDAASVAISAVSKLTGPDALGVAGMASDEELRLARAAPPLPVRDVRADRLGAFSAGMATQSLLVDEGVVIVPIYVGDDVRCAVELQYVQGTWKVKSIGGTKMIRAVEASRRAVSTEAAIAPQTHLLVRIPALHRMFIGGQARGKQRLFDVRSSSSGAGSSGVDAEAQFVALAPDARSVR